MPKSMIPCETCDGVKYYRSKSCARCAGVGRNCGGPKITRGYRRVWAPDHPLAGSDGNVLEHRKVLHDAGIEIPSGFHVHHVDGDKLNNDLANLVVKPESDHHRDHIREAGFVVNQYGTWPLRDRSSITGVR